jgi:hypothetical protein
VIAIGLALKAGLGVVWGFLKSLPWQVWAAAGALVIGLWWGEHRHAEGKAEVQAEWNIEKAVMREAYEAARRQGIEAKKKRQARGRWILTELAKEKADALASRDRVIADLRTGALRLRNHWTCPAGVPAAGTPTAAGRSDAAADLRAAGAGDLVRLGADADRLLRACQRVIEADRAQLRSPTPD